MSKISYLALKKIFQNTTLFEGKTWQLSPNPLYLGNETIKELEAIGQACYALYKAQDRLYQKSKSGENIFRNSDEKMPWISLYLDRGKPSFLTEDYPNKPLMPSIIRPDLLLTQDGWALTELDCVPGGIGLTAFLYEVYTGNDNLFLERFWNSLQALMPTKDDFVLAILISEESKTYRPEFEWIASRWKALGRKIYILCPEQVQITKKGVFFENTQIDLIYRFFELFDFVNIPCLPSLMEAEKRGLVKITPPIKTYQEEKMTLALWHHPLLRAYWQEQVPSREYTLLYKIIPPSWIVNWEKLPPGAFWESPHGPIPDFLELAKASQKERNWILKISGFDETAWGARGVYLANDLSQKDWQSALLTSKKNQDKHFYILQEYKKPTCLEHPIYNDDGKIQTQPMRLRLCPYYAVDKSSVNFLGALATFCPKNKKIIHGMEDAALVPLDLLNN